MKLRFDANQDFQIEAVKSVVRLFEGQTINSGEFEVSFDSLAILSRGTRNNLTIGKEQILANLQKIQAANGIEKSESLEGGLQFSIEMETGTGKTYVYLRTIYELNKQYGFKKFVIVVPGIAIKEGVLKNLEITRDHFKRIYSNTPSTYRAYDSKRVSALRDFLDSSNIQILVINIDSFVKDDTVINQNNDKLTGKKPVEFIRLAKPVVIIDEPQNMETDKRRTAIEKLNPVFTLRYSATHKNFYNLVYSLNPVRAYDLGLVKQIEVDSVIAENEHNTPFIELEKFNCSNRFISATIKIECGTRNGIKQKRINVRKGNDLYMLSGKREIYKDDFVLEEIDAKEGFIKFANNLRVKIGQNNSILKDEVMKKQMKRTIAEHLDKEKLLNPKGIKVLSLFFIDRVANYKKFDENGKLVKGKFFNWFEEIYKELAALPEYSASGDFDVEKIHNGYFSCDKKGRLKDSSGEAAEDNDAYRLIMKDKERVLSLDNPLKFIFSHSALREGWDNPNVFQICTLNETVSLMKKRQEIGRGLRLCVDSCGRRIFDKNINKLTVIANERYDSFAAGLQKEIQEDCGIEFSDGRIKDKRDRVKINLRKDFKLDKNFIDLWERIKNKTFYRVKYDSQKLIEEAVKDLKEIIVAAPEIVIQKGTITMDETNVSAQLHGIETTPQELSFRIPNIIDYIQARLEAKLTRKTILRMLKESGSLAKISKNPQMFLDAAVSAINNVANELMVGGIEYHKIAGQYWEMKLFENYEVETYKDNLYKISSQNKTISDSVMIDSSVEKKFAEDCESSENVEFFIKLPAEFKIKTPLGFYNPDWALICKKENKIYFVAETKSTLDESRLRLSEGLKLKCGEAHFKEFKDVKFECVTSVEELLK
uniref:Type III restriction enzyme n=1 Tax=Candidatus Endomicrobium sp. MdDo-005 TaxID=1837115 RepID=A0A1C9ZYQ2_9BACT|nr:type III restriction enzyme [Candidatus Endomicrobium sp. MdDo-005]